MPTIEQFRNNIINSGIVLEPEGVHSEFASDKHGQKLDFDKIDEKDPLYGEWIDVNAAYLQESFPTLPEFIVGVANGTNRVVHDTAKKLQGQVVALESYKEKENSKKLHLQPIASKLIAVLRPRLVVVVEDVGTTGSNSVQVAVEAREAGAQEVIVATTWKRRARLEKLEEAGIEYRAIIAEELPTFDPDDCRSNQMGFCKRGWLFKQRSK